MLTLLLPIAAQACRALPDTQPPAPVCHGVLIRRLQPPKLRSRVCRAIKPHNTHPQRPSASCQPFAAALKFEVRCRSAAL